jgi:antitoxin YefM
VIITRRGNPEVALIAAEELAGLQETAHLLRSPKNAERLLRALGRAIVRTGRPRTVEALRKDLGLERKWPSGSGETPGPRHRFPSRVR